MQGQTCDQQAPEAQEASCAEMPITAPLRPGAAFQALGLAPAPERRVLGWGRAEAGVRGPGSNSGEEGLFQAMTTAVPMG